jgi:hypothetical protein
LFFVESRPITSLKGEYVVTGSVKGTSEGATTNSTLASTKEQGTLQLGGLAAELEGRSHCASAPTVRRRSRRSP